MLQGKNITLIVSGSIAAYKSAELVRELVRKGARVSAVMTDGAKEFITPMTLQTLSGNPVATAVFDLNQESEIGHIKLADSADLILVCPATANIIAKAAQGLADDIATTVLLAARCPVVIAPAMNVNMWNHPATQHNLSLLRQRGVTIIEPTEGDLACGWQGMGRLAELPDIIETLARTLSAKGYLGAHVIVTAGPTHEALDSVRYLTNHSSGKMGFAIAKVAKRQGASVTLISGPTQLAVPQGIEYYAVTTALEMRDAVLEVSRKSLEEYQAISRYFFMAAAVSDHRPTEKIAGKLKLDKTKSAQLELTPNPDILQELGDKRAELLSRAAGPVSIIGFAAETGEEEDLIMYARDKLERKSCDMIVGNFADEAFRKDTNRVWLLDKNGHNEELATSDKESIAARILARAQRL